MYENNFLRNIDNNEYYVPQNFRPTYEDPYSARFVNAVPSNYYEDTVVQNFNRREIPPYNYNNENYNAFGTINYDNIHNFDPNNFMEANNIQYYEDDIELEEDFMEMYPEVYKKVTPIIDRIVNERKIKKVNNGVIDLITLEIYDEYENNESKKVNSENVTDKNSNVINKSNNINVSSTNTVLRNSNNNMISKANNNIISKTNNNIISKSNNNSRNEVNKIDSSTNINNNKTVSANIDNNEKTVEVATRYRNTKNPTLRDLIRILLLNKLFGNGNRPRPPRPRPYQNYNPRMIPTNYNFNSRYDDNMMPENNYMRSYFNSPYPEENQ